MINYQRIGLCLAMIGSIVSCCAQSEHARIIAASYAGSRYDPHDMLVSKPDYVVYVPRLNSRVLADRYNDHFQVFNKPDGTLFATWTQATKESDIDQHIAFSKSKDGGLTWSDPIVLAGSANRTNPQLIASWQQPMVSKSGRIYMLWNQQVTNDDRPHCGNMFGIYSDDDGQTWSAPKMIQMQRMDRDPEDPMIPPSWCNWQRPLRLGEDGKYLVGVSRRGYASYDTTRHNSVTEFLQFDNIDEDPNVEDIKLSWFATNQDSLKVVHKKFGSACEEAAIVKLPDGRLFSLMRTSSGHPYWSQSRDDGKTWSEPKPLLDRDGGTPYLHQRSPCPIYDWKGPEAASGYYFAFVHNTFDFDAKSAYQQRGPLYLIAGKFNPNAEQPIEFSPIQLFSERVDGNAFYTSITSVEGKTTLWYPDRKYYLLGKDIGEEWFVDLIE